MTTRRTPAHRDVLAPATTTVRRLVRKVRGFIVPIVLIAISLTTLIGSALVSAAWRSARGTRMAWAGEQALHAADDALAAALDSWTPARISQLDIGAHESPVHEPSVNVTTTIDAVRTSPTTLLLHATATAATRGSTRPGGTARRRLSRLLELDVASLPIRAAFTALGPLELAPTADIVATGTPSAPETSCGTDTDSASTAALAIVEPFAGDSGGLVGRPRIRRLPVDTAAYFRSRIANRITALAIPGEIVMDGGSIVPTANGSECLATSGEPARGAAAVAPCIGRWPTRLISGPTPRVTLGNSRHQGTLVVDGDLELAGDLQLRGLLVVRGTLDTRGGSLDVTGAVIVNHHEAGTSYLGPISRVRFSRCAVLRAVTPLATPTTPPVHAWVERH
jgi:hypothetical protein